MDGKLLIYDGENIQPYALSIVTAALRKVGRTRRGPVRLLHNLPMTLRELQYLVALADHGHFGRAAEACHVTQPTLSTQLRKLEAFLGAALLERDSKSIHLTPIGVRIVARARILLAEVDAIRALARAAAAPLSQPLTLGVIPTLGPTLLPWLTPAVARTYPALGLVIHEDLTDGLLRGLTDHRLDAAILALPLAADGLATAPLFDEPFLFAAPPGHPAAARKAVDPVSLGQENLLLLTDGHCLRDQALAVCGLPRPAAGADFRATSLETLRQLVAAGLGCTLLPAMTVAASTPGDLVIRPIRGHPHRRIGLVWRERYDRSEDMHLLSTLIRDAAPDTVERCGS